MENRRRCQPQHRCWHFQHRQHSPRGKAVARVQARNVVERGVESRTRRTRHKDRTSRLFANSSKRRRRRAQSFSLHRRVSASLSTKRTAPTRPALVHMSAWCAGDHARTTTANVSQPEGNTKQKVEKREAAQSEPQHASASVVKPGLSTQYMLVLAGTANFRVDSVAAWLEVHAAQLPSLQGGFVHYNFDENIKPLALLDLLTRVQAHFFTVVIILPPASTWSRSRHTESGQQPLRSRSNPLGLQDVTAHDYDHIQHSNKVVEVSWWVFSGCTDSGRDSSPDDFVFSRRPQR